MDVIFIAMLLLAAMAGGAIIVGKHGELSIWTYLKSRVLLVVCVLLFGYFTFQIFSPTSPYASEFWLVVISSGIMIIVGAGVSDFLVSRRVIR